MSVAAAPLHFQGVGVVVGGRSDFIFAVDTGSVGINIEGAGLLGRKLAGWLLLNLRLLLRGLGLAAEAGEVVAFGGVQLYSGTPVQLSRDCRQ